MDIGTITLAIKDYFRGERLEMFAILGGSLGLVLVAAALYAVARDGFARGFGVTALLVALTLSSTAVSLLRRDPPHEAMLVASVQSAEAKATLTTESARMTKVVANYPIYRYTALGLAVLACIAVAMTRRAWVNGAATGVLTLVIAQWMIDHYSEERATRYAEQLQTALATMHKR